MGKHFVNSVLRVINYIYVENKNKMVTKLSRHYEHNFSEQIGRSTFQIVNVVLKIKCFHI